MANEDETRKERPQDAGNPTEQDRGEVREHVQEGQKKAEQQGVEPAPPEPKTI